MKFEYLKNRIDAVPVVAKWYLDEWGYLMPEETELEVQKTLEKYLNTDKIPLMLLATDHRKILAVAQLKFREMDIYPEKEHWLGGVYVEESIRGKGLASIIISEIIEIAKRLKVEVLHLQTIRPDGGLYSKLGWEPYENVNYKNKEVLVMEKKIIV